MLTEAILSDDEIFAGMDERMMPLWLWHSIEEREHKSVAFNVYQDQVEGYWIRVSEMAGTTVEFIDVTIFYYLQLRADMDDKTDLRGVFGGLNWLASKPGWLCRLGPAYRAYYKPTFIPGNATGHTCAALDWRNWREC